MSEVNLRKEAADGARAKRVIEETNEYFELVRKGIIERWSESPVEDKEGQHKLRLMLKLLEDVRANLKTAAFTGEMARIQIQEEEQKQSKVSKLFNYLGVRA